jgi:hypothetical protein
VTGIHDRLIDAAAEGIVPAPAVGEVGMARGLRAVVAREIG